MQVQLKTDKLINLDLERNNSILNILVHLNIGIDALNCICFITIYCSSQAQAKKIWKILNNAKLEIVFF